MALFRCPTRDEMLQQIIKDLPRGRAWQTRDTGPVQGDEIGFDPVAFDNPGFDTVYKAASVQFMFWKAVASFFDFINQRICALRLEFWCATQTETRDMWLTEYALPSDCDPFPDLCTKVAAIGGTRCEYYQFIAARAGWAIHCIAGLRSCGTLAGQGGRLLAGRIRPGRTNGAQVAIIVDLPNSPSFSGIGRGRPLAGRMLAGRRLGCEPDISPLECLLARVVHAEIQIIYEVAA